MCVGWFARLPWILHWWISWLSYKRVPWLGSWGIRCWWDRWVGSVCWWMTLLWCWRCGWILIAIHWGCWNERKIPRFRKKTQQCSVCWSLLELASRFWTKYSILYFLCYLQNRIEVAVAIMMQFRISGGSRAAATSKIERFVIIVNGLIR